MLYSYYTIVLIIHVTTSLFKFSCFNFLIPDQCVESSLQEKISSPARTVSIKQEPEDNIKQEPEDHKDLSKFQAPCLYFCFWRRLATTEGVNMNQFKQVQTLSYLVACVHLHLGIEGCVLQCFSELREHCSYVSFYLFPRLPARPCVWRGVELQSGSGGTTTSTD